MIEYIIVNPEALDGQAIEPFRFNKYVKSGYAYIVYESGGFKKTTIKRINELLEHENIK